MTIFVERKHLHGNMPRGRILFEMIEHSPTQHVGKKDIEREILEEPDRIRGRYAVQTVRLEPVGIVYLWPDMG